jgi:hypothetical protein
LQTLHCRDYFETSAESGHGRFFRKFRAMQFNKRICCFNRLNRESHMFSKIVFTLLALCLPATFVIAAEEGKGTVNWTGGYVSGFGSGTAKPSGNKAKDRLHAIRVAQVTAQRALLETINGVKIDSLTTVQNLALIEDKIKTRVEGIIKGAQVVDTRYEVVDGAPLATVEMRVCLAGGFSGCKGPSLASALDLDRLDIPASAPPTLMAPEKPVTPLKPDTAAPVRKRTPPAFDSTRKVTGAVFKLDGRYFERVMLPVIATRSENGMVTVYCVKQVKPAVVRTFGAVRYADAAEHAARMPELGDNLIHITVDDISRDNIVIISPEDANILRQTMMNGNDFISDAKVVISNR